MIRMRLAGLILGVATVAAAAHPAQSAVFKWANNGDIRAMDPYTLNETVQNSLLANIYEPLVRRDKKLAVEPALATSWEQTSDVLWRFHLRPGVKWEDGSPLTANDVVFSFKRISSKSSQLADVVASIKGIRKIDDLTVEVETKGPDPIQIGRAHV